MIIVPKDTTPHCTIDLQPLNTQYLCETHHSPSPFQLVSQIPTNTYKTVLDAVGGYHTQLHSLQNGADLCISKFHKVLLQHGIYTQDNMINHQRYPTKSEMC